MKINVILIIVTLLLAGCAQTKQPLNYSDAGISCFSDAECEGRCVYYDTRNLNTEALKSGGNCQVNMNEVISCTYQQALEIAEEQERLYAEYIAGGSTGPVSLRNPLEQPCAVPGTGYSE